MAMRQLLLVPVVLLVSLVLLGGTAAADDVEAPLAAPTALDSEAAEPAPMTLEFPRRRASLVGPRALVAVKCSGDSGYSCEGTLVLNGLNGAHKIPYVIERGETRSLTVPLGAEIDQACRAQVVARTLQLTGRTVRSSSVLRIS
jgi:hypothetical protein